MNPRRDTQGFTLIELLIVVVIIGILAAIAIPKFSATREKAFRASMMSDLKNLAIAQDVYYNSSYVYESSLATLQVVESDGVTLTVTENTNTGWAANAVHEGLAGGEVCGIYHGSASAANGAPATVPGVVTCNF